MSQDKFTDEIEDSIFASDRLLEEIRKLKDEIKELRAEQAHRKEENTFLHGVIKRLTVFQKAESQRFYSKN
jgi:hypothetical protein